MKLQRIEAPTDGTPFWIFHDSSEVLSPNRKTAAYFHHLSQMPHGDSYFQLLFAKRVFPGFIWGTASFWSPCSRFIAASWAGFSDVPQTRQGVLIDLAQWRFLDLGPFFEIRRIDEICIEGTDIGGNPRRFNFERIDSWQTVLPDESRVL